MTVGTNGCGRLGVFLRIVAPISRGPIAGMAIININWIWSELFFSLILMNKADVRTLPLAIALYKPAPMTAEMVLGLQYAAMAIATIPVPDHVFPFPEADRIGYDDGGFQIAGFAVVLDMPGKLQGVRSITWKICGVEYDPKTS